MHANARIGKDERRAAIIAIAREEFLREGYASASMSQIAVKVGGSKATLYSYFPSKRDLFFAVVETESGKLLDDLYRIDTAIKDVRAAMHDFCRRFITMLLSEKTIAFDRIVTAESVRFPEIGQAAHEFGYKRGLDRMVGLMKLGMEAEILRRANPVRAAEYMLGLCYSHLSKLRLWNVIQSVTSEQIDAEVALVSAAFLALFGNDELAAEARGFVG
jgi:TetR/AcrR family transcriptional regulator, mexJK operon transcriptional repressor